MLRTLHASFAAASLIYAGQAAAQQTAATTADVDSVVDVVGTRRDPASLELLREIPQSVSIIGGEELEEFVAVAIDDIFPRLGSIRWENGNPRTGSIFMRGLTTGAGDPSILFNVDGISYAYDEFGTGRNFIDVETISVQRGPHGTRGGKSSSVGSLEIVTKGPDFEQDNTLSITLGQLNTLNAWAAAGGTIVEDKLAWRGTFLRHQAEGPWKNPYPDLEGRSSYQDVNRSYGRIQTLWTPSENLSATFSFDISPRGAEYYNGLTFKKDTPDFYANGAPVNKTNTSQAKLVRRWFTQQSAFTVDDYWSQPVTDNTNQGIMNGDRGARIDVEWQNDWGVLRSLTGWKDYFFSAFNDDGTPFDVTLAGGMVADYKQLSQELRRTASIGERGEYDAGVFYLDASRDNDSRTRSGSDAGAWNANPAQYSTLDADSTGRELLLNSRNRLFVVQNTLDENDETALFANLRWKFDAGLTLAAGLRAADHERRTSGWKEIVDGGYGTSLNPAQVGGFSSETSGGLTPGANSIEQLAVADSIAAQYFNVPTTAVPGAAYTSLTAAQKRQVAAAKAVRAGAVTGLLSPAEAEPFEGTVWTGSLSLTKEFSERVTGYVAWNYNEKTGISQFDGTSKSRLVRPEQSNQLDIGVRTAFFADKLVLNASLFTDTIEDYQATTFFLDEETTQNEDDGTLYYASGVGNIAKVKTQGLEIDTSYRVGSYTTIRLAATYADAKYVDHKFAAQSSENANLTEQFWDVSGRRFAGSAKVSFNLSASYNRPVGANKLFHTSLNNSYTGRVEPSLSAYEGEGAHSIVDFALGLGTADGKYNGNFVVKNVFDEDFYDVGWSAYTVNVHPRWAGVTFTSKW